MPYDNLGEWSPQGFIFHLGPNGPLEASPQTPGCPSNLLEPWFRVKVYGHWLPGELQHIYHGAAELYLFGHCLQNSEWIRREFAAALQRGNLSTIADWPGSYTAIILSDRRIIAYGDIAGQFPIHYAREDAGDVLIASDPAMIASTCGFEPDPVTAAIRIACPDVLPLQARRSPFRSVGRLEGGEMLSASSHSLRVDTCNAVAPSPGRTLEDAAEELRYALTDGVRARCQRRLVSSDFSGGVDSTSIAFLAVRASEHPVPAFLYHQPIAPAADLAEAIRCAELESRFRLTVVRGTAATLPFAAIADAFAADRPMSHVVPRLAEPYPAILTWRSTAQRLVRASEARSDLHLTGEGGDALLMSAPSYLSSLARCGSYAVMLRHCGAYGRMRNTSPTRLAHRAARLARTDPKTALRLLAAELQHPRSQQAKWSDAISWWPPGGEPATWLTRRIRTEVAELASDSAAADAIPPGVAPADMSALTQLRSSADSQRHLRDLGRRYGLAVHAPLLDSAVVRAALSIPAATRADPWTYKPLLRSALTGLVPDEVLSRRTKGDYSAEDYRGARHAGQALRSLLSDSRLASLGVIEPTTADATLQRMCAGLAVPLGPLNMLLATEVWLRVAEKGPIGVRSDA